MQNTDEVIQQGLAFVQTPMGLGMLLLAALLVVMCVLLTVLVVSLGSAQRTLVAQADSANKVLSQIRNSLASADRPFPIRHKAVIHEPDLPMRRVAGSEPPRKRESGKRSVRPARSARNDSRTDVYVSADAGDSPPRRNVRTEARKGAGRETGTKRDGQAGASTDVFQSVDI